MHVELVTGSGEIVGVSKSGEGIPCSPFYVNLTVSTKRRGEPSPDREYDIVEVSLTEDEVRMLLSMLRG